MPAASLDVLFTGGSDGDPIVLYDAAADRYIVTEFEDDPNGFHVAVSQTNDPINDGWHIYSADSFQTGEFPDYTKFSIWSDGYYITANISGTDDLVWAIERDKMLVGDANASIQAFPLPGIATNGFYSPQAFNVTDGNLPAAGNATIVYMQDDAWLDVDNDHLKLWTINVDWEDENNSTISAASEISTSAFTATFDGGDFSNLSQPSGPDIDAMQATIMNQAQFRKFATHNSVVFNFVVNTDTENELAGIRWYELRQTGDGQPWSIYQEGTYVAPEGRHAFGASMAMDGSGNIGMGYSSVSTTESISLRYTGRFNGDALNIMTGREELIVQSTSDCPSNRYADYSHLTVDPSNDADFWFVSEYFNNGVRSNRVGVFQISEPLNSDLGISNISAPFNGVLTDSEEVTISITNYGLNTQSNFPVSYSIDGGTAITETFTGSISQGEIASYTFITTADLSVDDQTYDITVSVALNGDEDTSNDTSVINVTNALAFCLPSSGGCNEDGIKKLVLGSIDIDDGADGCNSTGSIIGYVDRKELSTDLSRSTNHILKAQHNYSGGPSSELLSMWIDFDDNGIFDTDEQLILGEAFSVARELEDFNFTIPTSANLGSHVLRLKAIDGDFFEDINDPCSNFNFGEVHDYTVNITEAANNDLSIISFDNPSNGVLTNSENITITIANNGTNVQSNFSVSYSINGGDAITETFTGSLSQNETFVYTFNTTADLSIENQTYTIEAFIDLDNDENTSNNTSTVQVVNAIVVCFPNAILGCGLDGIKQFILGDINIDDGSGGCNTTGDILGYVDRKELSTDLDRQNDEPYILQVQHNFSDGPDLEALSVWVDFNDDGTFDTSEQLIQGEFFSVANQLESFNLNIPVTAEVGLHTLRAKAIDASAGGDINDACSDYDYGEVHDYTVNIIDSNTLSSNDFTTEDSDFKVLTLSNEQYEFRLKTTYEDLLQFRVYDLQGKLVVFNNISKEVDGYRYLLDMSYASSGIYIVQMGSKNNFRSYKIIVD